MYFQEFGAVNITSYKRITFQFSFARKTQGSEYMYISRYVCFHGVWDFGVQYRSGGGRGGEGGGGGGGGGGVGGGGGSDVGVCDCFCRRNKNGDAQAEVQVLLRLSDGGGPFFPLLIYQEFLVFILGIVGYIFSCFYFVNVFTLRF